MTRAQLKSSHGKVLAEMTLVLPLLLIIPLMVFEVARFLKLTQLVNVVSQEVATQSFRQCSDFLFVQADGITENTVQSDQATERCIRRVVDSIKANTSTLYQSGFRIKATVYRVDIVSTLGRRMAMYPPDTAPPGQTPMVTRMFMIGGTNPQGRLKNGTRRTVATEPTLRGNSQDITFAGVRPTMPQYTEKRYPGRQRVVVSEVEVSYLPIVGVIPGFGKLIPATGRFYRETTIL